MVFMYLPCIAGISGACCTLLQELPRHGSAIELTTNELYHYDLLETPRNGDLTSAKIADLSYISRVSKEVLRLTPPVGGGCRTVLRTMELGVSIEELLSTCQHSYRLQGLRKPLIEQAPTVIGLIGCIPQAWECLRGMKSIRYHQSVD